MAETATARSPTSNRAWQRDMAGSRMQISTSPRPMRYVPRRSGNAAPASGPDTTTSTTAGWAAATEVSETACTHGPGRHLSRRQRPRQRRSAAESRPRSEIPEAARPQRIAFRETVWPTPRPAQILVRPRQPRLRVPPEPTSDPRAKTPASVPVSLSAPFSRGGVRLSATLWLPGFLSALDAEPSAPARRGHSGVEGACYAGRTMAGSGRPREDIAVTDIASSADVSDRAEIGEGSKIWHLAQIREDAVLGEGCVVGRGAYVGPGVQVGKHCKIQNYALVYEPARLGDGVFIGPAVVLTNDTFPRAVNPDGSLKSADDWIPVGSNCQRGRSNRCARRVHCAGDHGPVGNRRRRGCGGQGCAGLRPDGRRTGQTRRMGWQSRNSHSKITAPNGSVLRPDARYVEEDGILRETGL